MPKRRLALALAVVLVTAVAVRVATLSDHGAPETAVGAAADVQPPTERAAGPRADRAAAKPRRDSPKIPSAAGLARAAEFAGSRDGVVSFAVVNTKGTLRGRTLGRLYPAASAVKAMLLAAEVQRLANEPIDAETDALLRSMITRSDNDAADAVYARVGDAGLNAVAERAAMTRYTVAGHWGNSQIAAGEMALFFADLDEAFPRRHSEYAKGLLGSVVPEQSWGIPDAAGGRWAVRFKGGWLPEKALVHQAAELREVDGERTLAVAVLTDAQPSNEYGVATVRGLAARLLDR
jgi:hypothetical protein